MIDRVEDPIRHRWSPSWRDDGANRSFTGSWTHACPHDAKTRRVCTITSARECRMRDALDDAVETADDLFICNPKDTPPELLEVLIPRSIVPLTPFVIAAIDFNDEPHLGASEVNDVRPDNELTSKREANLGAGEPSPKPLFGARGRERILR